MHELAKAEEATLYAQSCGMDERAVAYAKCFLDTARALGCAKETDDCTVVEVSKLADFAAGIVSERDVLAKKLKEQSSKAAEVPHDTQLLNFFEMNSQLCVGKIQNWYAYVLASCGSVDKVGVRGAIEEVMKELK